MPMYRVTMKPLNMDKIHFRLDSVNSVGCVPTLVSECHISQEGGTTTYKPIPPETSFGSFPEQHDDEIRLLIHSYLDGLQSKPNYSWIFLPEEK